MFNSYVTNCKRLYSAAISYVEQQLAFLGQILVKIWGKIWQVFQMYTHWRFKSTWSKGAIAFLNHSHLMIHIFVNIHVYVYYVCIHIKHNIAKRILFMSVSWPHIFNISISRLRRRPLNVSARNHSILDAVKKKHLSDPLSSEIYSTSVASKLVYPRHC